MRPLCILALTSFVATCGVDLPELNQFSSDAEAAYERMQQPYILAGEDVEALYRSFNDHAKRLGDKNFAAALHSLPNVKLSAVRYFVDVQELGSGYPKTKAVLADAPEYAFEAARMSEEDARRE